MFIPSENLLLVCWNKLLESVFSVAKIPMFLVFVFRIAGFIEGSIPIIGVSKFSLRIVIAFVVAVLQATTISLQFKSMSFCVFFKLLI